VRILRWLDQWHWVWIALAAPFLIFPTVARSLAMLIIPGVWIIGLLARREPPLRRTPLNPAILLLAVMVLVSLYATYDFAQSFTRLNTMVLEFGLYFAIVRSSVSRRGWWLAMGIFLFSSLAIAGLGLLGATRASKIGFLVPLFSSLPLVRTSLLGADQSMNPNLVAGAILWTLPTFLFLFFLTVKQFRSMRYLLGTFLTLVVTTIVITATIFIIGVFILMQSRSAYLGFMVGVLALGTIILRIRVKRAIALGALIFFLLLLGLVVFMPQGFWQSGWNGEGFRDLPTDAFEARLEIWSRALYGIQDFPFTGMGMDTFRRIVHILYPLFLIGPDVETIHAHNEYLQCALDLGIPGLIAFVALYIGSYGMLFASWRMLEHNDMNSKRGTDTVGRLMILGLGTGLFSHMIYGLTDATLFVARHDIIFWMLIGLIAGLYDQAQSGRLQQWHAWFGVSHPTLPSSQPESLNR
jgi:putative inorganic carbon (HCO3(-)) transporter